MWITYYKTFTCFCYLYIAFKVIQHTEYQDPTNVTLLNMFTRNYDDDDVDL